MSAVESQPGSLPATPLRERDRPFLEEGSQVGRYRILKRLGTGAMGEVYLGIDESLGRRAAIKVLGGRHLTNPTTKERFLREARALARHAHPNLITVFESGVVGQRPYYAMELLEGGDTQTLLEERGPLPSGVVAIIGAEAAAGLGEAARAHIIHRDVKPANLGISAHGVLKVTDFGLAKSHATESKSLTGEGFVVGTADYIAPEQARGEPVDERADVYALGCTLFHLLTGRPPFRSGGKTDVQRYADVMRAHLNQPVPDARTLAPETDPELAELIMRLMHKQRDQRPTFEEVAPLLAGISARLGGELPRVTRKLFTLPTGAPVLMPSLVEPAAAVPASAPNHRLQVIGATCAMVLSAIALVIALLNR
ncbi:MAG TPA: serine/threonine-protein kinase [Polyangia bacterium]|nr:serine/threonine-protein kinase [Polyangia bacterium]